MCVSMASVYVCMCSMASGCCKWAWHILSVWNGLSLPQWLCLGPQWVCRGRSECGGAVE